VEIIELSSDADSPPPGDASNPIVLDSEDEADQRGSSVYPLLEASQSTARRRNIHSDPPSGPNHLALSHTSRSIFPPDTSNTGDEFRDAEPLSVQRASLSPQSEHSLQAVDQPSVVNGKTDQTPLAIQDNSEIQDKVPNGVSENTREASSPVASSPSPMSPKSRNMGISDRLATPRISSSPNRNHLPNGVSENTREASFPVASSPSSMSPKSRNMGISNRLAISRISSSPNRSHLPPVDASADSSFVPVRGTLYGGRSGLWKGFFRVTTSSPSKPSRDVDVEEEGDARSKEAPTPPRANSPRKITPTTLVSLAQNMTIRSSPTPPSVDGRDLEISDDPTITTLELESDSSADIGEPSR
jgi:hypothetical protein